MAQGRAPGWSWQRVVGDLHPSTTAKILLPSDVANQFTGVVHFVLSHNKPLIPGLETDLDSVCAVCGSAGLFCCAGARRSPAAGECWGGGQGCPKEPAPSWAQKRTVSLTKLHTGDLSWPDVSQSLTCSLGDQILLTRGKHRHCQLCSWCQWDFFSLGPGLPSEFPNVLVLSEQNSRRFKKDPSFFAPVFHC